MAKDKSVVATEKDAILGLFSKGAQGASDYEKAMQKAFGKLLAEFTVAQLLELGVITKWTIRESTKKDDAFYAQFLLANGSMGFAASNQKAFEEDDNTKVRVSFREKGRTAFIIGEASDEEIEWRD